MNVVREILRTKAELARKKRRSIRRIELETRLRDLVLRQLRSENRKKAA